MAQIVKRIGIGAPCDQVWNVLANFGGVDIWAPTVQKCYCPTENQRGVGARRILTTSLGQVTEEIVIEWEEGHRITFEIPDGLASVIKVLRETWSVEQLPTGTRVVVNIHYQVKDGIINSLVDALVVRYALTTILIQNLRGLKRHVELGQVAKNR